MDDERRTRCPENRGLAAYVLQKKQEHADKPKGLSENLERTFVKAYRNVCDAKDPINTLKQLSQIKGFGKWMIKLMKGYFDTGADSSEQEDLPNNRAGIKANGKKRYIPQRNSVAYALLITLHRKTTNGKEFMRKQELIDAADASGLSHAPVGPEKGKGKAGLGHSKREWYSGWNCMTTLIQKGLVVKSSNPAKYMLTVEGREVANECIVRSGLPNSFDILSDDEMDPTPQAKRTPNQNPTCSFTMREEQPYADPKPMAQSAIPSDIFEKFIPFGYSKEQVVAAFREVSDGTGDNDPSTLWLSVMCHLRQAEVYSSFSDSQNRRKLSAGPSRAQTRQVDLEGSLTKKFRSCNDGSTLNRCSSSSSHAVKACSSSLASDRTKGITNFPRLPPLKFGETFEEAYDVMLILDDREKFATKGSRSRNIIDNICSEFNIKIEVRRLPVGDCIWIARHKCLEDEYVLDFIAERKNVDDMRSSIRDNRYRDQKLRLQRSGLKKLIYILEGDPNHSDAAESIKTACFTTEILEGFDVLRTNGLGETLRKYGYLTKSIYQYYKLRVNDNDQGKVAASCPSFDSFVKRCQDLDKMTISDVFAIQLMQVLSLAMPFSVLICEWFCESISIDKYLVQIPQVTEEIAMAVLDMYPTLLSLASAYSHLEGDVCAQEEMLRNQSNNVICASASKIICKLVWGE
ncbi:crossover junction endonuclease MUS81 isoform X1 [Capsella rubella]|uniref:crossover junction endonuclease MUS81 isoform X1 n=1 Tax=Capsella rubella TaxID=81985 RepID=UPI000CD53B25|nr:crossover junction endonuclease MUS81 isoform X1 [Capsella rubella]XP_023634630.1 crossover junction endonuclease MUS81 isoform X1 [Capsella rubella]